MAGHCASAFSQQIRKGLSAFSLSFSLFLYLFVAQAFYRRYETGHKQQATTHTFGFCVKDKRGIK